MKVFKHSINLDRVGITASTLCAIHCMALPFLLSMLPMWGLGFLADRKVEVMMILTSMVLGIWSLGKSYKRDHQKLMPIVLLAFGFAMIAAGHFSGIEILEPIFIPLGGFTIAAAHVWNLRLIKRCALHHEH